MSDTRQEAAQEMAAAGLQSGMEDALGSSLSSSFAPPSTATAPKPATEVGTTQAAGTVASEPEAESTPVPGMDEWKEVYDNYVEEWQAESAIAREKAISNRKYYEDLAEKEAKAKKDEAGAKKRREAEEKRRREGEERLRKELAGELVVNPGSKSGKKAVQERKEKKEKEEEKIKREEQVKEAWHLVQAASGGATERGGKEVVTDGRGVTAHDVLAGQTEVKGEHKSKIQQTMYDPTTSTEPLPPSMQDPTPSSPVPMPSESQTLSRHSATSQAWTEISGSPSSAEDLSPPDSGTGSGFSSEAGKAHGQHPRGIRPTELSSSSAGYGNLPSTRSSDPEKSTSLIPGSSSSPTHLSRPSQSQSQPPAQPPSLTLALFSSPSNLSISRLVAVLGINLVLPFINGVMLGFGEIFAREAVKVGRLVFRGERSLFGWNRRMGGWGDAEQGQARGMGAGRGVAGVGLSGSAGFP